MNNRLIRFSAILAASMQLAACGGSSSSTPVVDPPVTNVPPVITAGDDFSADEQTQVALSVEVTSTDSSIQSYLWSQTAGTEVAIIAGDSANASFIAPTLTAAETLSFSVTVTEADGDSSSDVVAVTINPVNAVPVITVSSDTNIINLNQSVTLAADVTDTDGEVTSIEWLQTQGASVVIDNAASANASFVAPSSYSEAQSELSFEITATDNEGASVSSSLNFSLNSPPMISVSGDLSVNEQTSANLMVTASDSDGTIQSYQWMQTSGTEVELTAADTENASFVAPSVTVDEQLTFSVTVTDDHGGIATDSIAVTVMSVNAAPVVTAIDDYTLFAGLEGSLSATVSDDGEIVSYLWEQTSGTFVVINNADSLTASFTAPQIDEGSEQLQFSLTVADNQGATATDLVNVEVVPDPNSGLSIVRTDAGAGTGMAAPGDVVTWEVQGYTGEENYWVEIDNSQNTVANISGNERSQQVIVPAVAAPSKIYLSIRIVDADNDSSLVAQFSQTIDVTPNEQQAFAPVTHQDIAADQQYLDLNLDGLVDLVTIDSGNISWQQGLGGGDYAQDLALIYSSANPNITARFIDVNVDGMLDIAFVQATDNGFDFGYALQVAGQSIVFTEAVYVAQSIDASLMATFGYEFGDITGDGLFDAAVSYQSAGSVVLAWYQQNAGQTFSTLNVVDAEVDFSPVYAISPQIYFETNPGSGLTDIIIFPQFTGRLVAYRYQNLGDQDQAFQFQKMDELLQFSHAFDSYSPKQVERLDFNLDGIMDFAIAYGHQILHSYNPSSNVRLLAGNASGTLTLAQSTSLFTSNVSMTVGDVDNDGDKDVVFGFGDGAFDDIGITPTYYAGFLGWFESQSNISDQPFNVIRYISKVTGLAVIDFDHDGRNDIWLSQDEQQIWLSPVE